MKHARTMRPLMIAAAVASASASAEPASTATHMATTTSPRSAHVQLASADHAAKVSNATPLAETSARKPGARVTTCRCGDQLADPTDDPSEQPQD